MIYKVKRYSAIVFWKRGGRINQNLILRSRKFYKIKLPLEYKKVILSNNYARPSLTTFDTEKSKEHVFNRLLSLNKKTIKKIFTLIILIKVCFLLVMMFLGIFSVLINLELFGIGYMRLNQ